MILPLGFYKQIFYTTAIGLLYDSSIE